MPSRPWIAARSALLLVVAASLLVLDPRPARSQQPTILVTKVEGTITPVIADHLEEAVRRAENEGHRLLLVEMDTPGGLDASMRDIIQAFLTAGVPVVVHVAPSGARAASAGALITMAAHVNAMAPGTVIGAATPVDLEGGDVSRKIINDAAAYAESIARLRGRNTEFAVEAVREGRSATADEAVEIGVVDLLVPTRSALLAAIDGRTVQLEGGLRVTISTEGATLVEHGLGRFRQLLQWLADPNLAFLFISIGTLAIVYELANPGIGGAGIVGVILIILALFGLSILPVTALGSVLLALAVVLFVAEVFTPGVGAFAAGGTAALVLGGMFLFRGSVGVSPVVLIPVAVVAGGGAVLAGRLAWRSRRLAPTTGTGAVVGRHGVVRSASGTTGQVVVDGTWWNARSASEPLSLGARVRVVDMEDLVLIVEPEGRGGNQEKKEGSR